MSAQIGIIERFLKNVFGTNNDLFITVKPKDLLFDGLKLCKNPTGVAQIICNIIKKRNIKAFRQSSDGAYLFSFFNHVSIFIRHAMFTQNSNDLVI